jgi:hypothetical protein
MNIIRKAAFAGVLLAVCMLGFWLGFKYSTRTVRTVDTQKMELCLQFYRQYRQDNDQKKLAENLKAIDFTPMDFQTVIDRFIYYRTRKSSIDHAFKLLRAFRMGVDIEPIEVVEVSGFASEPFRLDAEILAVFESRPELVQQAFES